MLRSSLIFLFLLLHFIAMSQEQPQTQRQQTQTPGQTPVQSPTQSQFQSITVQGTAYDSVNPSRRLDDLMIINLRTSQGTFGKADGTFNVSIEKTDTIMVASNGYVFRRITFNDSIAKSVYSVKVPLIKLSVTLKPVTIFSARDLQSIYNDIKRLGYNKKDFELSGVDALNSPITFLYQQFSSLERLKAHNRERINDDKRRQLLKELLANYVSYDIINLDNFEFDDFIDFCNVPEDYLKSASQYDFCIYVKQKYEVYAMLKNRKQ
jgi:hypothetical protein